MTLKVSAGLLMYRMNGGFPEVLLGHPGGPYYAGRDGSIPKGQIEAGETLYEAAVREFTEETGFLAPICSPVPLGHIMHKGASIHIWAFAGDCDATSLSSNLFTMEWPLNSGIMEEYPEFDRLVFFLCLKRDENWNFPNRPLSRRWQATWLRSPNGPFQHNPTTTPIVCFPGCRPSGRIFFCCES
jgi:predicted NUDIX family NTP pyrophosphohydrolase